MEQALRELDNGQRFSDGQAEPLPWTIGLREKRLHCGRIFSDSITMQSRVITWVEARNGQRFPEFLGD
jgi:hypothetical protein